MPLKLKVIRAVRIRLQLAEKTRDLALFNPAIDSKLRDCDVVNRRVCDIAQGKIILSRAMILQREKQRSVQFGITAQTRQAVAVSIEKAHVGYGEYLFTRSAAKAPHLFTRHMHAS